MKIYSSREDHYRVLLCLGGLSKNGRGKMNQQETCLAKALGIVLVQLCNCSLLKSIQQPQVCLIIFVGTITKYEVVFFTCPEFSSAGQRWKAALRAWETYFGFTDSIWSIEASTSRQLWKTQHTESCSVRFFTLFFPPAGKFQISLFILLEWYIFR